MKIRTHWEEILETMLLLPIPDPPDGKQFYPDAIAIEFFLQTTMKWHQANNPNEFYNNHAGLMATEALRAWFSMFKYRGAPIYKMGRVFGETLRDAPVNIAASYIRFDGKPMCIEFPESVRFDFKGGLYGHCAYAFATNFRQFPDYMPTTPNGLTSERGIQFLVPLYTSDGTLTVHYERCGVNFTSESETLEEAVARARACSDSPIGFHDEFFNYILKCMLYINSGDPDLRQYRPERKPSNVKALKRWLKQNISSVPMTLVGFDFKKPKVYGKDSTTVRLHTRWQPYGPQRSKVKLIWIDEHTRTYRTHGGIDGLDDGSDTAT